MMLTEATNTAELISPMNARLARLAEHELVDVSIVRRKLIIKDCAHKRGPKPKLKSVNVCKGVCSYADCPTKNNSYQVVSRTVAKASSHYSVFLNTLLRYIFDVHAGSHRDLLVEPVGSSSF